ncbi:MAG: cysteine--tRNA ligase [Chloroflexota bacterium]|nr:cysteine--tRNA ligase [Chloroflexota bacterium]
MGLHIFNYLTRQKELFEPLERGQVGMYVCGPTVYDHAHLGHAKTYVAMDVIVRYLRHLGYKVRYIQNITDVGHILDTGEDRILKGARRERIEPMEVVETYTRSYFGDMDALGVIRPNISPRASGHIPEQIGVIRTLIEKGYAYETVEGDVYFSVEKFSEYGKLSGHKIEELEAGARVAVREEKHHPADFALWKHAEPEHILRWPSPWGWGYPGWHVECTAMATKYLGETFDIHGGGLDNIFPHNECEIAQSEAATGKPFARYWMLSGSLTINGVKMSKSLGNFLTIKDALQIYSPEALRLFILSSHYRGPMDFSRDAILAAERGVERLHNTVRLLRVQMEHAALSSGTADLSYITELDPHRNAFMAAMDDDFNTPKAIASLFDFNKDVNALLASGQPVGRGTLAAIDGLYRDLGTKVLGIIPDDLTQDIGSELVEGLMDIILDIRQQYRTAKDWNRSDALRHQLAELGIAVDDRPEGPTWRVEHGGG